MHKGRDFLVYLAGPISGLSYADGQDWRDYVALNLPQEIRAVSPLRAKAPLLKGVGIIEQSYTTHPLTTDDGITARDRFDCMRADAVLFNLLGTQRVSVGTCMEFGWADATRKPIVLVIDDEGNPHDHPMVRGVSGWRVNSLDAGIELLEHILMPEGKGTPRELLPPLNLLPPSFGPTGVPQIGPY
jgi:nucleoside 2-deoxyribosyltransferase